jgi:putative DNA primase/helicase
MQSIPHQTVSSTTKTPEPLPDKTLPASPAEFLAPFFPDPYEDVNLRFFAPKKAPDELPQFETRKIRTSRAALEVDEKLLAAISTLNLTRGAYFVVNAGGDVDADIKRYNAFFCESDDLPLDEQHALLDRCQLRPSIRVETKKSVHAYWLIAGECSADEWREIQQRLITAYGCDPKIKNPSRVMRVPGFNHITYNKEDSSLSYKTVELVEFDVERRYSAAQMRAFLPPLPPEPEAQKYQPSNRVFSAWDALNDELKRRIVSQARRNHRGNYEMKCPAHNGEGITSLFYNPTTGAVKCLKGCAHADVLIAFGLPAFPVAADTPREKKPAESSKPNNGGDNTDTDELEEIRCTDMGNGYRFARQHKDTAKFCYKADKWYVWDALRWIEDNSGEAVRLAKATVKTVYTEAAFTEDKDKREAIGKHALRSEGDSRVAAMLHQAQSEMPVKLEAFDQDTFAFNCENGTLDLRTGELHPHAREDFITKLSSVVYDDQAKCPKWESFLAQIFDGDEELITFIQKAIGYSLTGSTEEQCFFIGYGTGANGKSVFLKTVSALTAEYGQQVRSETLMTKKYQGVSNDIAALRGARFLSAVETDSEHKLAEATVKQLTGGDTVRARFLFQEEFEFSPQFKLWLACNHKPTISNDNAIWRRIRLIPFGVTIPKEEQNPRLDLELREELPGILAWAVRGCLLWQHEGLGEPAAVQQATSDYREEMDTLSAFFADRCELADHFQVTSSELYAVYGAWCSTNGETAMTQKLLAMQLKERGFKADRKSKSRFWLGIGLRREGSDYE